MDRDTKVLDEKIKSYFEDGEFEKLPELLKERHRTMYRNYTEMKEFGLDPVLPDFMVKDEQPKNVSTKITKISKECKKKRVCKQKDLPSETDVRPKRNVSIKNYKEDEVPAMDNFIYCDICEKEYEDVCPNCGTMQHLQDTPVEFGVPDRAKMTVPKGYLLVRESPIHGLGVFAEKTIPIGTRMGPYEGLLSRRQNAVGYSWMMRNGKTVDAKDPSKSNWMRYVNCARHVDEQNVMAFQYKGQMYYRTVKNVKNGQELLVYYGDEFAINLGINTSNYFKPKEENIVEGVFCCPHCPFAFIFKDMRDIHELKCKFNPSNGPIDIKEVYICAHCEVPVSSKEFLEKHEKYCKVGKKEVKKTSDDRKKLHPCSFCNYTTKYSYILRNHIRGVHKKEKIYKCEKCNFTSAYQRSLNTHLIVHYENKRFVCLYCRKSYTEKKNLILHLMSKHNNLGQKPYICQHCNYKSFRNSDLKLHVLNKHSKIKRFKCEKNGCKYQCNNLSNLKFHSYIHLNLKPFKCTNCEYSCRDSGSLKKHLKKKHCQ